MVDVIFIGGGIFEDMFVWIWINIFKGICFVVNGVMFEVEVLIVKWYVDKGGDFMCIEFV